MWDAIRNRELNKEEGQCTWAARRGAFVMPMRTPFRSDRSRAAGRGDGRSLFILINVQRTKVGIHLISEPYLHLMVCEMQQTCVHAHRCCA